MASDRSVGLLAGLTFITHGQSIETRHGCMSTAEIQCQLRRASVCSQPRRKVAHAVMMARRLIEPPRIGPYIKIANVQHMIEANSRRRLECEQVLIATVPCSVNRAGSADEHQAPSVTLRRRCALISRVEICRLFTA